MTRQSLRCGDFINAVQEYAEIVLAQAVTALILARRCPGQRRVLNAIKSSFGYTKLETPVAGRSLKLSSQGHGYLLEGWPFVY